MIRQGDVLLKPIDPQKAPIINTSGINISGERTGHSHRLAGIVRAIKGLLYIHVIAKTMMKHEEHTNVEVPAGWYQVITQREFIPSQGINRRWD